MASICLRKPAETATRNLAACGFSPRARIIVGDWTRALNGEGAFDLIVSNPPYIPSGEIETLAPEVRLYDPRLALDGGADGLDAYRAILPAVPALLAARGALLLEVGAGQAEAVLNLAGGEGLADGAVRRDLAGIERVVQARKRLGVDMGDAGLERSFAAR